MVDNDTTTLRLEQDGSSGNTPQVWEIAGNDTGLRINDITNSNFNPVHIQPGTPSDTLTLRNTKRVGNCKRAPSHTLHVAGNALVSGNLEVGSSRLHKKKIRPLNTIDASATLAGLQPVRFHYVATPGEESLGFIAEDVPDLVATGSRKSINTMDIVAVLTKVVQEQQAIIAKLQQSVKNLENSMAKRE